MTATRRAYSAGHFELAIDGHKSSAYLKSVEGGYVRTSAIDEPIGPFNDRIKHTSVAEIEPFTCDCGLAGLGDVLRWIQSSWKREFGRRSGQISHADFNLKQTFEHEFYDALISETTFPALDGASKDAAYMKIKFQPERVVSKKKAGAMVQSNIGSKQKLWTASSFQFNIDGVSNMKFVNKLESFTVKQGIKKFYTGQERFPQIEPTKLEFPNISGTIALDYADDLLKWYQDYVVKGQSDPKAQKSGSLQYLGPDKKTLLFEITFQGLGMVNLQTIQAAANQDAIKRVKFELYCSNIDISGPGSLGLE
jgi:hypothetical protein